MESGRAVVMRTTIVSATAWFVGYFRCYLSSALKSGVGGWWRSDYHGGDGDECGSGSSRAFTGLGTCESRVPPPISRICGIWQVSSRWLLVATL